MGIGDIQLQLYDELVSRPSGEKEIFLIVSCLGKLEYQIKPNTWEFTSVQQKLPSSSFLRFINIIVSYTSSHTARSASSETQGRSFGSEWTASKVFMNGRESPRDTILNEPVLRLIRMLVSDWAQKKIRGKHLSHCFCDFLIRRCLPANSTVCYTCLASAWQLSSRRICQWKWGPQNRRYPIT